MTSSLSIAEALANISGVNVSERKISITNNDNNYNDGPSTSKKANLVLEQMNTKKQKLRTSSSVTVSSITNNNNNEDNYDDGPSTSKQAKLLKDVILDRSLLHLKAIKCRQNIGFTLENGETYDQIAHRRDMALFNYSNLNAHQRIVYDYMQKNPNHMILIQAGPGCGKSFVLKAMAYHQKRDFETIIYKHDLLSAFKYNSRRFTVARFMMQVLNINFCQYRALEKSLSSRMDAYEYILVLISMLKEAQLPDIANSIVFLDEYTVMSKSFLLIILMLLEAYNIGAVICGDRNQLQNIHNSRHTSASSYSIAQSFVKESFYLTQNERCSNADYNEIINYISEFSSDRNLDEFGYALVSAILLPKIFEKLEYNQIHLAGTHQELANLQHNLSCEHSSAFSFYYIDRSRVRNIPQHERGLRKTQALENYKPKKIPGKTPNDKPQYISPKIEKFLPYLPLIIGGRYYINRHSEQSQGTLIGIVDTNTIKMRTDDDKVINLQRSSTHDEVIFDQHREYLLDYDGKQMSGRLYNFPIYPANFMTIHKCQGCTITDSLNLILTNTSYQGLYVALSRVQDPKQISRVLICNQMSHVVSTIINFPEYCEYYEDLDRPRTPTAAEIRERMVNYMHYDVNNLDSMLCHLTLQFNFSKDTNVRIMLRNKIIEHTAHYPRHLLKSPLDNDGFNNDNSVTLNRVIKYRDILLAVSNLDIHDRNVWLHEFMLNNLDFKPILPQDFKRNSKKYDNFVSRNETLMTTFAQLNSAYPLDTSSKEYIRAIAKTNLRMNSIEDHEKYIIERKEFNMVVETTEFCAKVYKKYENKEICTKDWLINELNNMLAQKKEARIHDEKNQSTQNDAVSSTTLSASSAAGASPVSRKQSLRLQRRSYLKK